MKLLDGAFDPATGKINKFNKQAVELKDKILQGSTVLMAMDRQMNVFAQNVDKYPKATGGATSSLMSLAAGAVSVQAIFAGVSALIDKTTRNQGNETLFKQALGTQKAATEALEMLRQFADKNKSIKLDEITDGFIKLSQRGFIPTQKELLKLNDLAASTNKTFDQLAEAILDAQTGEFERLKEFGITASKAGDQITFAFKGQSNTVKATGAEIQKYILSLGDLEGVAGSTALAS